MNKLVKTTILALIILAFTASGGWAVKAVDGRGGYSQHSYHQTVPENNTNKELLPEIIHNPPLQIKSTDDFFINAQINNLGNGIPIIYYRFDGDDHYYKRAMRKSPSGHFQFKILGAALTGSRLDYYMQVATGSRVLATLGTEETPISVAIIAPQSKTTLLYFAIAAGLGFGVIKLVSANKKRKKAELKKDKTRVTKAAAQKVKPKRKAQLSAR